MQISHQFPHFCGTFKVDKTDDSGHPTQEAVRIAQETVGDSIAIEASETGVDLPLPPSLSGTDKEPRTAFIPTGIKFTAPDEHDTALKIALNKAGILFSYEA